MNKDISEKFVHFKFLRDYLAFLKRVYKTCEAKLIFVCIPPKIFIQLYEPYYKIVVEKLENVFKELKKEIPGNLCYFCNSFTGQNSTK